MNVIEGVIIWLLRGEGYLVPAHQERREVRLPMFVSREAGNAGLPVLARSE